MKNNNAAVIHRLTKSSLHINKKRNFFITMAIVLTTLLIAYVFSIGMSILKSVSMQQIRLMGTTAHASITHITKEQIERLKQLDYVHTVGTGNNVAFIKNTPSMGNMVLTLHYFDTVEWKKLRAPAYTDITGSYPQKDNEIMVPLWVLERLGINDPSIGMEIPLTYYPESGNIGEPVSEIFRLSGWFTSYVHIRSGNMDSILVSEALSQKYGKTVENDGSATVLFDNSSHVLEYCERLERDLKLSETQKVKPVPIYDVSAGTAQKSLITLSIVIAFLIFTGYLLIYNVLYISVSRDVRFYGLLKTLGTTPRQIRSIVLGQILHLCIIGIPLGAAAALLLSFVAIPAFISKLGSTVTGTVVSFSPIIYLGAALLALLTALLGAFKPAQKAAGIPPIEAQKFTGIPFGKSRVYSSARGKPYKMALRNIFRNGKRAVIVLLSLFLGIMTFLVITTLVTSMDTDNYVASYIESDFILQNNTVMAGYEPQQKFDAEFIDALQSLPGFESMRFTTQEWMRLDYSPDTFGDYVADYIKRNNTEGLAEKDIRNIFTGIIAGIDHEAISKLNATMDSPIDIDAFERGEFALLATNTPSLFENVDELTIFPMKLAGELGIKDKPGSGPIKVPIGGFVPQFFEKIGQGFAPTVFVSNTLMDALYGEPIISKIYIDIAEGYAEQALDILKQVIGGDFEISNTSKLEAQKELREAKMMLYILGDGIALILALIGILNFVNVMSVDIMVRKKELATLECVGMSRKQVRRMLVSEGLGYAAITLFFVFTAGNAITFGIFKLFQQQANYAIFIYPFIPVLIASLLILAICIITPEMAYRSIHKSTIVERLREAE